MRRFVNLSLICRWHRSAVLLGVTCICLAATSEVAAGHPPYVILRGPAAPPHAPIHAVDSSRNVIVEAPFYAYGWFGAHPRRHWSRHFGYYRNYTEWSAK